MIAMAQCRSGDAVYDCTLFEKHIRPLFDALDQSALAVAVKDSLAVVPWAGSFHVLGLAVLGGAVLMVDMRVLGAGLGSKSPAALQRTLRPFTIIAVVVMIVSGVALGLGEVMRLYFNPPFWVKMAALAAAIVFTFGVRDRLIQPGAKPGIVEAVLGAASIALWAGVFILMSNSLARAIALGFAAALALFVWLAGRGARQSDRPAASAWAKGASVITIAMWLTTAAAGRWIAFF
jgi:hypothetical protein